jgi:hypothetical protein
MIGLLLALLMLADEPPPRLLGVYVERVEAGAEVDYGRNEEEIARTCVRLKCPHAYLGLESVGGPKEVWWLNAYTSEADKERVARAWEDNTAATSALKNLSDRKRAWTREPKAFFATYAGNDPACWAMAGARYFVIGGADGCVFEVPDGTRLVIRPVKTPPAGGRVFAIRPTWSHPEDAWVAADPKFWRPSAGARRR